MHCLRGLAFASFYQVCVMMVPAASRALNAASGRDDHPYLQGRTVRGQGISKGTYKRHKHKAQGPSRAKTAPKSPFIDPGRLETKRQRTIFGRNIIPVSSFFPFPSDAPTRDGPRTPLLDESSMPVEAAGSDAVRRPRPRPWKSFSGGEGPESAPS